MIPWGKVMNKCLSVMGCCYAINFCGWKSIPPQNRCCVVLTSETGGTGERCVWARWRDESRSEQGIKCAKPSHISCGIRRRRTLRQHQREWRLQLSRSQQHLIWLHSERKIRELRCINMDWIAKCSIERRMYSTQAYNVHPINFSTLKRGDYASDNMNYRP